MAKRDLSPSSTEGAPELDGPVGVTQPADAVMEALPRVLNDFSHNPDIQDVEPELGAELKEFFRVLITYLEELRSAAKAERQKAPVDTPSLGSFDTRMARNTRRHRGKVEVQLNDKNEAEKRAQDGHAELGICQGLSSEGIEAITAHIRQAWFSRHRRPYVISGNGDRAEENRLLQKTLHGVSDDLLRKADFRAEEKMLCQDVTKNGTVTWRYQMRVDHSYGRDENGVWTEGHALVVPDIQVWELPNVLVTNIDRPTASQQSGVFWMTPRTTLEDLEYDEVIWEEADEGAGDDTRGVLLGKYFNLEALRELARKESEANQGKNTLVFSDEMTKIEFEGPLPIFALVRRGALTPRILRFLGVEVNVEPPAPDDPQELRAWSRAVARIPKWSVSYILAAGHTTADAPDRLVIQCEPVRPEKPRHSLYASRYVRDGHRFYGLGVVDLGWELEDAADCLRNSDIWAIYFNSHPARAVNLAALGVDDLAMARKLQIPNELVALQLLPDQSAEGSIATMQLPRVEMERPIFSITSRFEDVTHTGASAKGTAGQAPDTGTATEVVSNDAKAVVSRNEIVLDAGDEFCRMIRDMIDDALYFLGRAEFIKYAARVSGVAESDVEKIMPTIDGLSADITVELPVGAATDPIAMANMLATAAGGFPMAFPDQARVANRFMELVGVPHGEELTDTEPTMSPEDERASMAQGGYVRPKRNDDFFDHIVQHGQQELALQQGEFGDLNETELANLVRLLPMHQDETERLFQVVQAFLLAMQGGAGAGLDAPGIPTPQIPGQQTGPAPPGGRNGGAGGRPPRDSSGGGDTTAATTGSQAPSTPTTPRTGRPSPEGVTA